MPFHEPEVSAKHVQDKFKALLQSEFVCQSVITTQGVAQSSETALVSSSASATGKNDNTATILEYFNLL